MRRVNGDLAVSRALGDFTYKHSTHLPATQQQVSPEPEIRVEVRARRRRGTRGGPSTSTRVSSLVQARTDADQFVILACDGIWDVMTNEEVAAFLLEKTREGEEREEDVTAAREAPLPTAAAACCCRRGRPA